MPRTIRAGSPTANPTAIPMMRNVTTRSVVRRRVDVRSNHVIARWSSSARRPRRPSCIPAGPEGATSEVRDSNSEAEARATASGTRGRGGNTRASKRASRVAKPRSPFIILQVASLNPAYPTSSDILACRLSDWAAHSLLRTKAYRRAQTGLPIGPRRYLPQRRARNRCRSPL